MEANGGGAEEQRRLDTPELKELEALIRRSFRVRDNQTPVYVDVAGNLARVGLAQHQFLFGRRGSGKSSLLVFYRHAIAPGEKVHTIYINGDTVKTLEYPDVLIRLLLQIFEGLPKPTWPRRIARRIKRLRRRPSDAETIIAELRELLHLPIKSRLTVTQDESARATRNRAAKLSKGPAQADVGKQDETAQARQEVRESEDEKIRMIDARLPDYKAAIQHALEESGARFAVFIVDDLYLVNSKHHAQVIDYLHRLLRDTDLYLKIGTIRHRTRLSKKDGGVSYGVQPYQDVDTFDLDRTLEDLDQTSMYLEEMLRKLGAEAGIEDVTTIMSEDAKKDLVLLSGGVPRDYLNIFVEGLDRARNLRTRVRVTPTDLRKAAASLSQESKFSDLRDAAGGEAPELETLFVDLVEFCLSEKRTTAFLVSDEDEKRYPAAHELLKQLMDFKLVHLVEPSTSAASGRPGRFEAYTLDFSLFMEPRRRNIEIVRFWETDNQRRRVRLREAPVYDLGRGEAVIRGEGRKAEEALEVAAAVPAEGTDAPELLLFQDPPRSVGSGG
jgi:hypothetical protein